MLSLLVRAYLNWAFLLKLWSKYKRDGYYSEIWLSSVKKNWKRTECQLKVTRKNMLEKIAFDPLEKSCFSRLFQEKGSLKKIASQIGMHEPKWIAWESLKYCWFFIYDFVEGIDSCLGFSEKPVNMVIRIIYLKSILLERKLRSFKYQDNYEEIRVLSSHYETAFQDKGHNKNAIVIQQDMRFSWMIKRINDAYHPSASFGEQEGKNSKGPPQLKKK